MDVRENRVWVFVTVGVCTQPDRTVATVVIERFAVGFVALITFFFVLTALSLTLGV